MSWLSHLLGDDTTSPSVSFPFEKIETSSLGPIRRPVVTVKLWSDVFNHWHNVTMLIDTGADYTLLPQYLGHLFTTKKNEKNQRKTMGIGGDESVHFIEKLKVKVGPFEREIPVGIASTNKIPPLMGRHLFFETFVTHFDKSNRITFRQ